jgi:beta-glucosidase
MGFCEKFVWGSATAAYQVEGAMQADHKGLNIWDVFCKEEGHIYENQSGEVACDQYHKYKEDVQIMKELGMKAYRFSVSWTRILPDGIGEVNTEGLAYYDRLIDELLSNGIEPYMTLYHWDLPYELQKRGGWQNPDISKYFYAYTKIVTEHFSDRVSNFITINEPQCVAGLGYFTGEHAPGLKLGKTAFFEVWKNLLLAHGEAVKAIREYAKQPVKIGMAPCSALYYPASDKKEDIEAARRATFELQSDNVNDLIWNIAAWSDSIFFGDYPKEMHQYFGDSLAKITNEEWKMISAPLDFYGQNMYNAVMIRADEEGNPVRVPRQAGFPKTAIQWPVTPECMYWAPTFLYERYKKPFLITENGMSCHDCVSLDGRVHDPNRIDFMNRYLHEYRKAADDGVDLIGYFAWSTMDNFEWCYGYSERFGLIYVDYRTQERIIKDSAYYYKKVIESNGKCL